MHISGFDPEFVPRDVQVDDEMIRVKFESGLEIATPVSRFPRLQHATPAQRKTKRNPSLLPKEKSYESINRWFDLQFSDVA